MSAGRKVIRQGAVLPAKGVCLSTPRTDALHESLMATTQATVPAVTAMYHKMWTHARQLEKEKRALENNAAPQAEAGELNPAQREADQPAVAAPTLPQGTVGPTDEEIIKAMRDAGASDREWRELTREVGPYSITEPRHFIREFTRILCAKSAIGSMTVPADTPCPKSPLSGGIGGCVDLVRKGHAVPGCSICKLATADGAPSATGSTIPVPKELLVELRRLILFAEYTQEGWARRRDATKAANQIQELIGTADRTAEVPWQKMHCGEAGCRYPDGPCVAAIAGTDYCEVQQAKKRQENRADFHGAKDA